MANNFRNKSQVSKSKKRRLRRNRCKLKAEKHHRVIQDLDAPHHALDDAHHPSILSSGCLAIQQDSLSCHDPPADQPLTDDSESGR